MISMIGVGFPHMLRKTGADQPPLIQRDVRTHVRTYCGKPTSMTALASETGVRDAASQ